MDNGIPQLTPEDIQRWSIKSEIYKNILVQFFEQTFPVGTECAYADMVEFGVTTMHLTVAEFTFSAGMIPESDVINVSVHVRVDSEKEITTAIFTELCFEEADVLDTLKKCYETCKDTNKMAPKDSEMMFFQKHQRSLN